MQHNDVDTLRTACGACCPTLYICMTRTTVTLVVYRMQVFGQPRLSQAIHFL